MYLFVPFDRATSLFYWPNPLALYLGIILFIGLWEYRIEPSSTTRLIMFIVGGTFLLTQSLATFVYVAVILFIIAISTRFKKSDYLNIAVVVAVSIAISSGLGYLKTAGFGNLNIGTPDGFKQLYTTKTSGVGDRFLFWEGTLDLWHDNKLIGHGNGSFATTYPSEQVSADVSVQNPHNLFLQLMAELGIIGALLFAGFILLAVLIVFKESNKIVLSLLLLWLLHAGFYQTNLYPTLIVWLFIALIWSSSNNAQFTIKRWMLPTLASLLAVILVPTSALFISQARGEAGRDLIDKGKFVNAREMFEIANNQWLGNPDYLEDLAWVNYLIGDRQTSSQLISLAIERDSNDAKHYYLKGLMEFQTKNIAVSETDLLKSIELDPLNLPRTYVVYANLLLADGRAEIAGLYLDKIIGDYDDDTIRDRSGLSDLKLDLSLVHWQRARVALALNDIEEVRIQLDRVFKLNPGYPPAIGLLETINNN
jgi:tetratricopeptide (TPR) repeat protein